MDRYIKLSIFTVIGLMMAVVGVAGISSAYATTPQPGTKPSWNTYNSVPLHYGVGSESDFLRLGTNGELGNQMDNVCTDGQLIDLWFYIHNSTAEVGNGTNFDGPGVAHNTVVRLAVNEAKEANSHSIVASINADETKPVSDNVTVNCGDQKIKLKYKKISHFGTKAPSIVGFGNFALIGDIQQGAHLGYQKDGKKGIVPGCWEYRARINVQLEVEVVQPDEPEQPDEPDEPDEPEQPTVTETGSGSDYALAMLVFGSAVVSTVGYRTLLGRRN